MAELEHDLDEAWSLYTEARLKGLYQNLCIGVGLRALGGNIDINFLKDRGLEGIAVDTTEVLHQAGMELGTAANLHSLDSKLFAALINDPEAEIDMIKGIGYRQGRPIAGILGTMIGADNQGHLLAMRKVEPPNADLPEGMVVVDTENAHLMGWYSLADIYNNLQRYRDSGYDVILASVLKK